MGRLRVTIAGVMGLVALAALAIAALRSATPLSASALFSLDVAAVFGATVAALTLRGRARAVWGSFALCGGGYLWMSLAPPGPGGTAPHLITDALIDVAYRRPADQNRGLLIMGSGPNSFGGSYQVPYSSRGYWLGRPGAGEFSPIFIPKPIYQTAHALIALATAAAGTMLALLLTRTSAVPDRRRRGYFEPPIPLFDDHP